MITFSAVLVTNSHRIIIYKHVCLILLNNMLDPD